MCVFQLDTQDVPYDYDSIMHYHDTAFSKNGSKTIIAPADKTETMGKMQAMSEIDVEELNKLYECEGVQMATAVYYIYNISV